MDCKLVFALMVLAVVGFTGRGWAADDNSCIAKLSFCANYLNTTGKPGETCCKGLIQVIETEAPCLCGLLKSETVKQLGINMTKAMELPERCGKNATANQCTSKASSPTASPKGGSSTNSSTSKQDSSLASPGEVFSVLPMAVVMMVGVLAHLVVGGFLTNVDMGFYPN